MQRAIIEGHRVHEREELPVARRAAGVTGVEVRLVVGAARPAEEVEIVAAEGGDREELRGRRKHLDLRAALVEVVRTVVVPQCVERRVGGARRRGDTAQAADRQAGVATDAEGAVDPRIEIRVGRAGRRDARLVAQETQRGAGEAVDEAEAERLAGEGRRVVTHPIAILIGGTRVDRALRPVSVGGDDLFALGILGTDRERATITDATPSGIDRVLDAVRTLRGEAGVIDLESVEGFLGDEVHDTRHRIGAVDG